ncbi:hypothetical protein B0H14DRAFT_2418642 [Mycena olivaceomarginata]|nr:hypothetical protein B0H14DRAFT_2418644 [Mycena olivaceomarginata]KAJ7695841.1 hypothetical protein B0H14DRAFT_2418642 [Mycena olivaceomarginata]
MRFTISLLAAVLLAIQVNAQQFTAWTGTTCDGSEGAIAACDGTCGDFSGRHSFEVLGSAGIVTFFEGGGCTGKDFVFGPDQASQCIHVNTGTAINSYRCTRA